MKCCSNCFTDELACELAALSGGGMTGVCDVCGATGSVLYEVRPESELAYQFEKMFDVFASAAETRVDGESSTFGSLYSAFVSVWDVFSDIPKDAFERFALALFPDDKRVEEMIKSEVVLAPMRGTRSIDEFSVFGRRSWDDFAEDIKHRLRYCSAIEHKDILFRLLCSLERVIRRDEALWYRARIWNNKSARPVFSDLCEPGYDKAGEGRMSPKGVCCLYVANSPVTAIAEIRAALHDEVAVMMMAPKNDLRILDLSRIDGISPFLPDVECAELAVNIENLKRIKQELVRPVRATDDPVEYVPTQYIADCARYLGFGGIGYESVMQSSGDIPGYNIACFHSAKTHFEMQEITVYKIAEIGYKTSPAA